MPGIRKPQPEFLLEVMRRTQLNPEKTVMVGNDFTTDVAVAQSIGMEVMRCTFPYSDAELRGRESSRRARGSNIQNCRKIENIIRSQGGQVKMPQW